MQWEIIHTEARIEEEKYSVGKLTAKLIHESDLTEEEITELLDQDEHLSTSSAACVLQARDRILLAKKNKEKIFIGGDYDADGITSTAIMVKTLNTLGIENGYYLPDRIKEGYGLKKETVQKAYDKGYQIILTVDNGVKAHEALSFAKSLGMYVIVTDHHVIEEEIEADIVVHPDYMESAYQYLSGAGVALEISRNLIGEKDELTAMCAVALIADVMPLWKETRKIVKKGISILKQGRPKPLAKLLYSLNNVDETAIAFSIVPKLNAVGRMHDISNVNTVVKYLLLENEQAITSYASQLESVNNARKSISQEETEMALSLEHTDDFLVMQDDSFHEGICGLVAGKIAEKYHKPVVLLASSEDMYKGSGRSIPGLNMFEILSEYDHFASFGGHEQAVGLSIKKEDYSSFLHYLKEKMETVSYVYEEPVSKAIQISMEDISFDTVQDLSILSPYPKEMIKPYFALQNVKIKEVKRTAKTIKYMLVNGSTSVEVLVYTSRNLPKSENPSQFIGSLSINRFRGKIQLQMIAEDIL